MDNSNTILDKNILDTEQLLDQNIESNEVKNITDVIDKNIELSQNFNQIKTSQDEDTISSENNTSKQLNTEQLSQISQEFNKFENNTDILSNNSILDRSSGWIGTSQKEVNTSIDSFRCGCPQCCGAIAPDFNSTNTVGTLGTDTLLFDGVASDITNFPISKKTIDTVLGGEKWNLDESKTITYSFYDDDRPNSYYGDQKVSEVSRGIKNNVRQILKNIESFVDLKFVEVEDAQNSYGEIRYQLEQMRDGYAYAYLPDYYDDTAGDVFFSKQYDTDDGGNGFQSGKGTYGYETIIHETLHALGLKHPGDYNGDGSGDPPFLAAGQDNNTNTVMTYNDGGAGASTIMPYDIKALQYLYGANQTYNQGNTTYSFNEVYAFSDGNQNWGTENRTTKLAIWDTGGTDTLDFSKLKFDNSGYRFDLRMGGILTTQNAHNSKTYKPKVGSGQFKTSRFGTVIADEVKIENVVNSRSDDFMIANSLANTFSGYGKGQSTGDDIIVDSNGKDILDLSDYKVSDFTTSKQGNDYVIKLNNDSNITIKDYYAVAAGDRLKILTSDSNPNPNPNPNPGETLIGDNGANQLTGTAGNDLIRGRGGDDTLDGQGGQDELRGGSGNDIINGGSGNDLIAGGNGKDVMTGGAGADTFVYNSLSNRKDRITDFEVGQDKIDVSAIFDDSNYASNNAFGEYIQVVNSGADTRVRIDLLGNNGDNFKTLAILENVNPNQVNADSFMV